jgi:phytoene synthase
VRRWDIPVGYFAEFLDSMRADLVVDEYESHEDLQTYMRGSAAVIGLQMLPLLGRAQDDVAPDELADRASDLGIAFQLTNFLRDVSEDLDRGRIYLPQESLRRFGIDRARLQARVTDADVRALIAYEVARTRRIYDRAAPGIELVHPTSQPCLRTAFTLYRGILDEIERADYDVFGGRASVGRPRRVAVAARGLLDARRARRPSRTQTVSVSRTSANPNTRSSTGA